MKHAYLFALWSLSIFVFPAFGQRLDNPFMDKTDGWRFLLDGSANLPVNKNIRPDDFVERNGHPFDNATFQFASNAISLSEKQSSAVCQSVKGGEPGFYDVVATVSVSDASGLATLFAQGYGYSVASTALPVGDHVKVSVLGAGTADGSLLVGVSSDGKQKVTVHSVEVKKAENRHFLQGGDITQLNYILDRGGRYFDENGNPLTPSVLSREEMAQNVINYLAKSGMNFVRIRLSNNPGTPDNSNRYFMPSGYQDINDCIQLAQMAHKAGMEIQFTFNWSDFWSNGEQQDIPADWKKKVQGAGEANAVSVLTQCCYEFTKETMLKLAALDIYPAYVSLGNETNGGFLFPYGYAYDVSQSAATSAMPAGYKNWNAIASFVNAGYKAVKEVSPNSKVVIHLADATGDVADNTKKDHVDWWIYSWYFDELMKAGAKFDVIGASYYPSWSYVTASQAADYFTKLLNRYNKDILVMETGYSWHPTRKDGYKGQLSDNAPAYVSRFPFSENGQKGFMADVLANLKNCVSDNGKSRVVGDLYWDPVMIHVENEWGENNAGWAHWLSSSKPDANVVENTTVFDFSGKALPVLDVYRKNCNSQPLKKHKVFIVSESFEITITDPEFVEAYCGDSVSVSLQMPEGMSLDSCCVEYANGERFVYPSMIESLEVPDMDMTVRLYSSFVSASPAHSSDNSLYIVTKDGVVTLFANSSSMVEIFAANGGLISSFYLNAGENKVLPLPEGMYVVNGTKVFVR